ncbi:MAG: ATP-binding protein [Chloroflexota bacterium]
MDLATLHLPPGEVVEGFRPQAPHTLEELGLSSSFVDDLLVKRLFAGGPQTAGAIADYLCLPFLVALGNLNEMRRLHLTHVLGSDGPGERNYVYTLTDEGIGRARTALERNMYDGPAPVPVSVYVKSVAAQSVRDIVITRRAIEEAFRDLTLHAEIINEIGPAVNAGQSIFFYGAAGNGKTALATRITRAMGTDVFVPYALEWEGSVIEFFDPVCHIRTLDQDDRLDPRWIRIKRPTVVVGGELRLENLDLNYHPVRRIYEAPFQLKANTGMFLIDDFGRQQVSAVDLLNRWIVPLELRVDFLKLQSGRKIEVPFDELLVLSSNLDPASLMDEAFLRRIKYKVKARDPSRDMFRLIFHGACRHYNVPFDDEGFEYLVTEHYEKTGRPFRGVHPRDLLDQLVALARYIEVPPRMSNELLDAVVGTYFIANG